MIPANFTQYVQEFGITASDPDGDALRMGLIRDNFMPDAALLIADHGNGTATVTLNATGVPQGQYVFWMTVHDEYEREPYAVIVP